jgi:L-asparaginase
MTSKKSVKAKKTVKPSVLLIYTGGTIGMAPRDIDNPTSPLEPKPLKELLRYVPLLGKKEGIQLGYNAAFDEPLDSSDVTPLHWMKIARIIEREYQNYDGFVILHGTDTMAYTASGLAFILNNLSKPVVITGSQLPISDVRTDAVQNLVSAVYLAGYRAVGLQCIPEVILCFSDKVLRGCRATKVSTEDYAGFDSPNFPPLGTIGEHITINEKWVWEGPGEDEKFYIWGELEKEVMQKVAVLNIGLWPGLRASDLEAMLNLPNVKGVVLRTFGAGNAPGNIDFLKVIEKATQREDPCLILNVTQCVKGKVEMGRYETSSGLLELGVVSGLDMTQEAALAKLYWTLGTQIGPGRISQLQISQRGEQSENLFDLGYGPGGSEEKPIDLFKASFQPDGRLVRKEMSRAVVRLSGVGFTGAKIGQVVRVRLFMNQPTANIETPGDDPHCVAEFACEWDGRTKTLIQEITEKTKTVMGQGEIILTVVPLGGIKMWFHGLYLALFAKAAF